MDGATLRGNISRIYLVKALNSAHFIAGVLVPFFTDWGGISFVQVMWLQSWFVFWIFALEVPTGAFADRFGRKVSMICGSLSLAAAVALYCVKPSFAVFLAAEFFWALGAAFESGADEAILYDSLKAMGRERDSKSALGSFWAMHTGAIMLAAPVGSLIGARWGLLAPVALMAVPFLLAAAAATTLREPPATSHETPDYWRTLKEGLRYFFGHPSILALAVDSMLITPLCFMSVWLTQPFLLEQGLPRPYLGVVFAGLTGAQILVTANFGRLERLVGGARRYFAYSALIPGAAYLAMADSSGPWATAAAVIFVCGFGVSRPVLVNNYVNKHVGSHQRATVLSTVNMLRKLFTGLLYPAVGYGQAWSPRGTFAILGVAVVVCAAVSRVEERHLLD